MAMLLAREDDSAPMMHEAQCSTRRATRITRDGRPTNTNECRGATCCAPTPMKPRADRTTPWRTPKPKRSPGGRTADPRHHHAARARHELGEGADRAPPEAENRRRRLHSHASRTPASTPGRRTTGRTRTTRPAAPARRRTRGLPGAVHDLRQDRSLGRELRRPVRDGDPRPVEAGDADLLGQHRTARGPHRGGDRPDRLQHLRAAVQLECRHDGPAQGHLLRLPRGQALPGDAGVRPGAPRRGVPQARARQRRWARRADRRRSSTARCTRRSSSPSSSST